MKREIYVKSRKPLKPEALTHLITPQQPPMSKKHAG